MLDLECFTFTVQPLKPQLIPKIAVKEKAAGAGPVIAKPPVEAVGRFVRTHFKGTCVTIHFDGGQHTIGIVGLDGELRPVFAHGEHDEKYHTNNVAEC